MYCYVMVFLKSNLQCHLFVMRGRDAFGEDGMGDRQDRFIIAADHFIITMPLEGRGNHGVAIGQYFWALECAGHHAVQSAAFIWF